MPDHVADHLAPIPALAAIAVSTASIRMSTMVLSNDWRNPVLLAREVATLDWLSSGRLEFGVGAGWQSQDYRRLGVPYANPGVRIERLQEALEIMTELLSGTVVTRSQKHYQVVEATCFPIPVQRPHPPIVVGGGSRRILTLAGRVADIVNVHTNLGAGSHGGDGRPDMTSDATEQRLQWVREGARDRFNSIELGLRIPMAAITDRSSSAAEELGPRWRLSGPEVLKSPYALVGSVNQIAEQLEERRDRFGFSYFLWNESELESMAPLVSRLAGR